MNDEIIKYLKELINGQKAISERLDGMDARLAALSKEITGQFQMMLGNTQRVDGLERIASAHHDRLTALERKP